MLSQMLEYRELYDYRILACSLFSTATPTNAYTMDHRSSSVAAVMVRKRKYGKWLPVHLTENLISEGVDGLVGIEELTDYKIVKGDRDRSIHKVGKGSTMEIYIFTDSSCFPWLL